MNNKKDFTDLQNTSQDLKTNEGLFTNNMLSSLNIDSLPSLNSDDQLLLP